MWTTPIQFLDEPPIRRRLGKIGAVVVRIAIMWFISAMVMAMVASAADPLPVVPSARIEDARHFISTTSAQVLAAIDRERDAIRRNPTRAYAIVNDIVGPHVDFERISRLVLGKYWRTATDVQRKRFKSAFRRVLIQTYVTGVSKQLSAFDSERIETTHLSSTISKDGTEVTVRTRFGSAEAYPIRVDYLLQRFGETWQLYDIVIEGVSLVLTYRSSYAVQIERTGIDALIERIRSEAPGAYRELRVIGHSATDGN